MASAQHVLSEHPLNSEPAPATLVSTFLTPTGSLFNRNHGEVVSKGPDYCLQISSEVDAVRVSDQTRDAVASGPASPVSLSLDDLKQLPKRDVTTVLACAGNRRIEMNEEKDVEGLQWGGSAISNCHYAGTFLRDVLARVGVSLEHLEAKHEDIKDLHIHFETSQKCEEDDYYAASLPIRMALDSARPVLLAYEMNHDPLAEAHGAPLRLVVPGVIGARSVKWLERIIIRDREVHKVLPPEATPETKQAFLEKTPALMEFPLNSEICEPTDGAVIDISPTNAKVQVKGYAVGAKGTPIASVHLAVVPLPVPTQSSPFATRDPAVASSPVHQIRLHASSLSSEAWTAAELDTGPASSAPSEQGGKHWAWTLFSAAVPVPREVLDAAQKTKEGEGRQVALVGYAVDAEGQKQEMQTMWNLRGVAEASWSVVRVQLRVASDGAP
ncbi:uncharacterized protein JCM10292_004372 [Rhodotorula paludigena]|uniref:uncharacterized protein n=1 Tax=Rhodotorula paludigena TaxID=86838 RepID=UPI003178826C